MVEKANIEDVKRWNISYLIIFFVVIFISDDTFAFGTNQNTGFILFKYCSYLFLTLFLFYRNSTRIFAVPTTSNLILLTLFIAVTITAAVNIDITGGYIYQIWVILLGFLIAQFMTADGLVNTYLKFIYVLSLISLIVYLVASVFPILLSPFPVQTNLMEVEFYNLWVSVVFKDVEQIRNTGIFREPGVFMIYLSIAILFELFYKTKINKFRLIIFLTALFTTYSTAAFIILFVIIFAYLLKKNTRETVYNKLIIASLAIVVIGVVAVSPDIYSLVFDKIGKDSISDGSSLARGASVFVNYNIFIDNPLVGCGISSYPNIFSAYSLKFFRVAMDMGNNTNMIITVFAVYGLLFGVVLLYMVWKLTKKFSRQFIVRSMIFLSFLMMLSNEDVRYSLMTFVLFFWGLKSEITEGDQLNGEVAN